MNSLFIVNLSYITKVAASCLED